MTTKKKKSTKKKNPDAKPVGRPRIISSPEEFDAKVDAYIKLCQSCDPPKKLTYTGLVLSLGMCSRDTLCEYGKLPEFSDSVRRAKLFIENEYEQHLFGANTSGVTFALKNLGWSDKLDVNHGGQPDNPIVTTQLSEEASKAISDALEQAY
jgi:hypothetical protein